MKLICLNPECSGVLSFHSDSPLMWLCCDTCDCWFWQGTINSESYGVLTIKNKQFYAHRVSFKEFKGPIPDFPPDFRPYISNRSSVLDHTCHNMSLICPGGSLCWHRCCINPFHLNPTCYGQNAKNSPINGAAYRAQTHCKFGHVYNEANTYITTKGTRRCRMCRRASDKKRSIDPVRREQMRLANNESYRKKERMSCLM